MVLCVHEIWLEQASHVNQTERRPASRFERGSRLTGGCKAENMKGETITAVETGVHGVWSAAVDQQDAPATVKQLPGANPTCPAGNASNYKLSLIMRIRDDVSPPKLTN